MVKLYERSSLTASAQRRRFTCQFGCSRSKLCNRILLCRACRPSHECTVQPPLNLPFRRRLLVFSRRSGSEVYRSNGGGPTRGVPRTSAWWDTVHLQACKSSRPTTTATPLRTLLSSCKVSFSWCKRTRRRSTPLCWGIVLGAPSSQSLGQRTSSWWGRKLRDSSSWAGCMCFRSR